MRHATPGGANRWVLADLREARRFIRPALVGIQMSRRRRTKRRPARKHGPTHNEANRTNPESRSKEKMLDEGKRDYFRYYVKEVLDQLNIDEEQQRPFIQSLWSNGSRFTVKEAREFAREKVQEGFIDADAGKRIDRIIEQYSKWR